jgi:diadenosine tetraphosphate (Ap4A) HIT family hydrolase
VLENKEDVVADFDKGAYLRLQSLVYRVGRAVSSVLPTERLYVLSLGSKQGNAHVHWHIAPLPPGVPYEKQQFRALMQEEDGYLVVPPEEAQLLAARIAGALGEAVRRRPEDGAT